MRTSARRRRWPRCRPTRAARCSSTPTTLRRRFSRCSTIRRRTTSSGFHSTNAARDGSYRHLTVKLNRSDVKLEYRPGYYAPADFQHQKTEDREQALTEQMRSDLPATDVAVYLQALYFRLEDNKFFVPVSLIVPGSQIHCVKNGDQDKANIDMMGQVKNAQGIIVGNVRDNGEAGAGCGAAGAAEEHSILDRIYAGAG